MSFLLVVAGRMPRRCAATTRLLNLKAEELSSKGHKLDKKAQYLTLQICRHKMFLLCLFILHIDSRMMFISAKKLL